MNEAIKRMLQTVAVLTITCSMATAALAGSNTWPQWRGPKRDGHSPDTGLLKQWPAGGPSLAWKATGLGTGYASIVTDKKRLFTMGDKGNDAFVIALSQADGKELWSAKVGKAGATGWGGFAGPRSTPTVDGDLLFAVGQYGELVCLETSSGKERWRQNMEEFGGKLPEWGFSESPLVDGDKVLFTPGGTNGTVIALNKKTGKLIWQSKEFTDAAHYASIIKAEIAGVPQYIQLTDASVAGLGVKDGKLLWRAPRKGATAVIPTPIYHDNTVYVTSGYGIGCNLFSISKSGKEFSAEQVYANKVMVNHHGGVIRVGDHVYGFSDSKGWTCQDLKTGAVVWQEKEPLGKGSLVFADGHFYLRAEAGKGTVALIEATPEGYKEKGRFDQPERSDKNSWAHPVVINGKLYLRDQDILLCYDVKAK